MPNVVSKEKKEEPKLTDKKAANRWMVEAKDNIPHTVKAPKAKELLLWRKLIGKAARKGQEEEKEDKECQQSSPNYTTE